MSLDFYPVALVVYFSVICETCGNATDDGAIIFPIRLATHTINFTTVEGNRVEGTGSVGFIAQANFGTPPQQMNLFVDTGSSDIAVISYEEESLVTPFYTNRSLSFTSTGDLALKKFLEGGYNGSIGNDILQDWGKVSSLRVPIIAITSSENMFPHHSQWQGLWGLAFPPLTKEQSFMDALRFQTGITHYVLSFCKQNETDPAQSSGVLSFNGNIPRGTIFTTVYIPTYFSVYVANIKLGAKEWPGSCSELNDKPVIVDSGTTDLKVPQVVFDWMFDALCEQAAYNFSREENAVYCLEDGLLKADLPTLEIFLPDTSGEIFSLKVPPTILFQEVSLKRGDHGCFRLGVGALPKDFIIGYSILKGLTTVFDLGNKRVGFSPLHCDANDVIVKYADKNYTRHSCSWDFAPLDTGRAWGVFLYIILATCLLCGVPFLIACVMWLRRKIQIYRGKTVSDRFGLIEI